jgi:hypothetical protein
MVEPTRPGFGEGQKFTNQLAAAHLDSIDSSTMRNMDGFATDQEPRRLEN